MKKGEITLKFENWFDFGFEWKIYLFFEKGKLFVILGRVLGLFVVFLFSFFYGGMNEEKMGGEGEGEEGSGFFCGVLGENWGVGSGVRSKEIEKGKEKKGKQGLK